MNCSGKRSQACLRRTQRLQIGAGASPGCHVGQVDSTCCGSDRRFVQQSFDTLQCPATLAFDLAELSGTFIDPGETFRPVRRGTQLWAALTLEVVPFRDRCLLCLQDGLLCSDRFLGCGTCRTQRLLGVRTDRLSHPLGGHIAGDELTGVAVRGQQHLDRVVRRRLALPGGVDVAEPDVDIDQFSVECFAFRLDSNLQMSASLRGHRGVQPLDAFRLALVDVAVRLIRHPVQEHGLLFGVGQLLRDRNMFQPGVFDAHVLEMGLKLLRRHLVDGFFFAHHVRQPFDLTVLGQPGVHRVLVLVRVHRPPLQHAVGRLHTFQLGGTHPRPFQDVVTDRMDFDVTATDHPLRGPAALRAGDRRPRLIPAHPGQLFDVAHELAFRLVDLTFCRHAQIGHRQAQRFLGFQAELFL